MLFNGRDTRAAILACCKMRRPLRSSDAGRRFAPLPLLFQGPVYVILKERRQPRLTVAKNVPSRNRPFDRGPSDDLAGGGTGRRHRCKRTIDSFCAPLVELPDQPNG